MLLNVLFVKEENFNWFVWIVYWDFECFRGGIIIIDCVVRIFLYDV